MAQFNEPLRLVTGNSDLCEVEVDRFGRVHLSGLNAMFSGGRKPNGRFEGRVGFDDVTSLFFDLVR